MSNALRRNAIKDIFDSYELSHKKLNEDFAIFKDKIDNEIALEDEHASKLAELTSMINSQKLGDVKMHLADLGMQVQHHIDDYQEKVSANNRTVDSIYENNKQSLSEVCNIKRIIDDLDSEICKFLDYMDRNAPAPNELLFDTGSADQKWIGAEEVTFAYTPAKSVVVNEIRFALLDRPYVKVKVGDTYEPQYVDEPKITMCIDGYMLHVRNVEITDAGGAHGDAHDMIVRTESSVMLADREYVFKLASSCTLNLQMAQQQTGGDACNRGDAYIPAARFYGCDAK